MIAKHCVQTCVLSKRWKNLWKCLTNIKLFDPYNGVIFDEFVSQFLSCRDNSVPLHSISYKNNVRRNYEIPPKTTNILVEIMEYAALHNVQQLEIKAKTDHIRNLELPPSIFNCDSLTSLTLFLRGVSKSTTKMFPKSLNLPALKTLTLVQFTFFTSSDNGYAEPFSTCNMLNKLVIFACKLQDDAQGLCISNSKLSNLAIGTMNRRSNIHKVILCTPKLKSLTIIGIPPIFPAPSTCSLTNLLEELKFDCMYGSTMGEDILISWLHLIAKVNIMTLSYKILKLMILKNNSSMRAQLPSFVKLKSLKVEAYPWKCDDRIREMVSYLLQNSPPPATFDIISYLKGI
ncbi:unnamed protein product [Trifolium pratense]|uniref:Uncharacterized protein n=1 Tax=Trifolium pratense TaxID=57577 RepID=A0ACB0KWR9_TRIPR|nr:unnamed protein product [Trifolium pratense]